MYGLRLRDASLSSAVPYLNTFLGSMKQQFILPGHFEAQYLRVHGHGNCFLEFSTSRIFGSWACPGHMGDEKAKFEFLTPRVNEETSCSRSLGSFNIRVHVPK